MKNTKRNVIGWIVVIGIVIAAIVLYKTRGVKEVPAAVAEVPFAESRPYCFVYVHEATTDAPYAVEEYLMLSRVRGEITGEKHGTQSGPDMTNGYEGTLSGKTIGDGELELVYAYTIEGSSGKELESYGILGAAIVKKRYPLIEGKYNGVSMLIPDTTKDASLITYVPETCGR